MYIYGGFLKWWYPQFSSMFGFSIINQPFWGYPFDGNPQIKDPQNCSADDSNVENMDFHR